MNEFLLILLLTIITSQTQGQPCTLQFLPALQIITMSEDTQPGDLVARLQITGTASEISTRLVYNSSEVKTNGTEYFTLNFTNLYLRSSLDYEWWSTNNYPNPFRFIVECTVLADQTRRNIDFQLDLIDANDNPPRFNQSIYQINISEKTAINTIVSTAISAYDLDSGTYGMFSYYLSNNSSPYDSYFQLLSTKNAGLILVKTLDYNSMIPNFNLSIIAQDISNSSLSSQATLSIHIIDVDDLNPAFLSSSYNLNISINTTIGSEVIPNQGRIFAYDQDLGINTTIIYSILTSNIYLTINNRTGVITLQREFNSTIQFDLLIKAEQIDNSNRSVTTILHVNIFEINLYPPSFFNSPYSMFGYLSNNIDQIPIFNGTVIDNDALPRLSYGYSCDSSLLYLNIKKTSLRDFQIRPIYFQTLPVCQPCLCVLNVSDGLYSSQTNLNVRLYTPISFALNSYVFSADYPLSDPTITIGQILINTDSLCSVQYSLLGSSSAVFSISSNGNITWTNLLSPPTQEVYQFEVFIRQNCSLLSMNISTDVIVTIRNFPSSIPSSTSTSSRLDNGTIYAIIGSVGAFILIIVAVLFIIIYYHIQRAKQRVPPFFKIRKSSPAQGLTFFKSKSPLNDSSPYTLGVRDDDSSNSSSDHTSSSPLNNRLLSGRYKVNELPVNTTIEELLSSYDNRSTSSSSSSSGGGEHGMTSNTGSFRTVIRETIDHQQLDTINEDRQWMNSNLEQRRTNSLRHQIIPEDAMDIISESHESSISGTGTDVGLSPSTILHQQSNSRNVLSRNLNEYLTVFV
ncbi:hypothetical protein I4U23_014816 [Adineta vaga]|nr:hypothetical protein I4U23_014816 [Adineta vaga]